MQTVLWENAPQPDERHDPRAQARAVEISGVIERVTIHNEDSASASSG